MGNCTGKRKEDHFHNCPGPVQVDFTANYNEPTTSQTQHITRAQPASPTGGVLLFVALFDYEACTSEDLTFKKGDYLEVKPGNTQFDWWQAKSRSSNEEGYIPRNYVTEVKAFEAEDWFHGKISREEAEKLLLSPASKHGAFLIRESKSAGNNYALSVRDGDVVKHYRIQAPNINQGFFIVRRSQFTTLEGLIEHHKVEADGLCVRLGLPCIKMKAPQTVSKWEIDRNALTIKTKIGDGNFGEVWEGLLNKTIKVAIKTLQKGTMQPEKFLEEAEIMKKLVHPNLVPLFAVCSREEPIYIVTELMENGSLLEFLRAYIKSSKGIHMKMPKLIDFATQVTQGMAYLEKHSYVHRDLAARNVLVGETLNVKVADFGLSRSVIDKDYVAHQGSKFPVKWTAPEACLTNTFSLKSDIWSFGILIYEIVTHGWVPYPGMSNHEVIRKIVEEDYRMPRPGNAPKKLYKDIMLKCWARDPDDRPTFETLSWQLDEFISDDWQFEEADEGFNTGMVELTLVLNEKMFVIIEIGHNATDRSAI